MGRWRGAGGLPSLVLFGDYRRAVTSHISDRRTRQACRLHLLRWWARDWNLARVIAEMITSVHPPFENVVNRLKLHFYGPLPQIRRIPASTEESLELPAPAEPARQRGANSSAGSATGP
jgi:hypothetical protein